VREYLLAMVVAALVTYLTTGVVRLSAHRFGWVPEVRARDAHDTPTPKLGGVAMFAGFIAALAIANQLPMLHQRVFEETTSMPALAWGVAIVCVLGALDDRFELDALTQLAGQMFAASVMVWQGMKITYLPIPGYGPLNVDPTTGAVLSVLICLIMMNAVNFIDGLDGLAAGMACIAALAFFGYAYRLSVGYHLSGATPGALISAITVGLCFGFLAHNWYPARIFMGGGAQMLGLVLAASTISLTGQIDPGALTQQIGSAAFATHKLVPVLIPLTLPLTVLALPLVDMTWAIVRRTRGGRSPFASDKLHLHHRLLEIGHTKRRAVLIMYFWSALIAFVTVLFSVEPSRRPVIFVAIGLVAVGMIALMLPWVQRGLDRQGQRRHANRRPLTSWPGVTRAGLRRRFGGSGASDASGGSGGGASRHGRHGGHPQAVPQAMARPPQPTMPPAAPYQQGVAGEVESDDPTRPVGFPGFPGYPDYRGYAGHDSGTANGTPRYGAPSNGKPSNGVPSNGMPANGAPPSEWGAVPGSEERPRTRRPMPPSAPR
jgi:UDP-GlcNAc:undecaprenyl-phosphate GlcNAc-1-phosphate transferase